LQITYREHTENIQRTYKELADNFQRTYKELAENLFPEKACPPMGVQEGAKPPPFKLKCFFGFH
jgi:hypothetical protein